MMDKMRRLVPTLTVLAALLAAALPASASAALETLHLERGVEVQALAAGPAGTLWAAGIDRAKARDGIVGRLKQAALSVGAGIGFVRLFLHPVRRNQAPAAVRLAPAW